jgi:hypothetical protein
MQNVMSAIPITQLCRFACVAGSRTTASRESAMYSSTDRKQGRLMWTTLSYHQRFSNRRSASPQPLKAIAAQKPQSNSRGTSAIRATNTATAVSTSCAAACPSPTRANTSAPTRKLSRKRSSGSRRTGCQSPRKTIASPARRRGKRRLQFAVSRIGSASHQRRERRRAPPASGLTAGPSGVERSGRGSPARGPSRPAGSAGRAAARRAAGWRPPTAARSPWRW